MLRAFCLCFNSLSRGARRDSSLGEGANPLSLLPMVAASSPEGGAFFAVTETYRMNAKSFRQCYKLPPSGELARRKA